MVKEIVLFGGGFVLIVAGFIGLINWGLEAQCANNVTEMGRPYRYDLINGCRIGLKNGTFIYWDMYRQVNDN